jgi:cell division protein FtsW (lipid II flippase)
MFWAKVYNAVMIALYLAVTFGGVAMIVFADAIAEGDPTTSPTEFVVLGGVYSGVGVVLTVLFAVAFFWRKGLGAWIYQIVLIVLGLTSCCTWPATIPLIIYWIKDKDRIIQS